MPKSLISPFVVAKLFQPELLSIHIADLLNKRLVVENTSTADFAELSYHNIRGIPSKPHDETTYALVINDLAVLYLFTPKGRSQAIGIR
jgi:hypothetical protein